jgi:hypothetical protein
MWIGRVVRAQSRSTRRSSPYGRTLSAPRYPGRTPPTDQRRKGCSIAPPIDRRGNDWKQTMCGRLPGNMTKPKGRLGAKPDQAENPADCTQRPRNRRSVGATVAPSPYRLDTGPTHWPDTLARRLTLASCWSILALHDDACIRKYSRQERLKLRHRRAAAAAPSACMAILHFMDRPLNATHRQRSYS